jgi:hypothetical protein
MGRSRDIADILSKTELANTGNEALITTFDAVDSAYVSSNVTPALVFYSTLDSLPVTSLTSGQQAYVSANSRLYISDGSGWYNKALITLSPTMTLNPSGTITLATDGATASTVTIIPADSDTPSSQLSFSVESDGSMLGRAVLSQDSSVFTIRPLSSDSGATDGTFTLTFKTTDADTNFATASTDFSLTFATTVDSSSATVLLMKAEGSAKQNDVISYQYGSDFTLNQLTATLTNDPYVTSFSPYRSGGYSTHFPNGATGNLNWSGTTLSGDYTIEAWIYTTEVDNSGYNNILSDVSSNVQFSLHSPSNGNMYTIYQSAVKLGPTATGTGLNEWVHFVWEREGTTLRHYCNGALLQSGTVDNNSFTISKIGQYYTGGYEHHGYIRDLRVMSSAKYGGSSYTVPTEPLAYTDEATTELLACHHPYIRAEGVSISQTGSSIGTSPFGPYDYSPIKTANQVGYNDDIGSFYLDTNSGTGPDAVTLPATANLAFGTGAFTIEWWQYWDGAQVNYGTFLDLGYSSSTNILIQNYPSGTNQYRVYMNGTSTQINEASAANSNQWYHYALVRNGTTVTLYRNGLTSGSATFSGDLGSNVDTHIGKQGSSYGLSGSYIADFRIVKGTAVYTSNFTPPTSRLGWITGTVYQIQNAYDISLNDTAAANSLKPFGNAATSTAQRKFTTSSSVYFDGTGDYIDTEDTDLFAFGTGDFTWEMWLYHTTYEPSYLLEFSDGSFGDTGIHHATSQGHLVYHTSTTGTGSSLYTTGFGSMSNTTWYHIAASRVNGTTYLFKDGVLQTSAADTHDYAASRLRIGAYGNNTNISFNWTGYLQDLRISKGFGRYTSSFTPPTAEFEL